MVVAIRKLENLQGGTDYSKNPVLHHSDEGGLYRLSIYGEANVPSSVNGSATADISWQDDEGSINNSATVSLTAGGGPGNVQIVSPIRVKPNSDVSYAIQISTPFPSDGRFSFYLSLEKLD